MERLTRVVKGLHRFTLEGYSLCKTLGVGKPIVSGSFYVGGHEWCLYVYINGRKSDCIKGGDRYVAGHVYASFHVALLSESDGVDCLVKIKLLDQSGKGHHLTLSTFDGYPFVGLRTITPKTLVGFPCFIEQDYLERSSYLKDNSLIVECTVGVVLPVSSKVQQCEDVEVNFLDMLTSGEGSDVTFNVGGEKLQAHKLILSARSSTFRAMFTTQVAPNQQEIDVNGVEPQVFKALLHFIYSDTLPEDDNKSLETGYAFGSSVSNTFAAGLLALADEYDLGRLKNICEYYLWVSVSLHRFAETLYLAHKYKSSTLKRLCFEYATDNYYALVELDGLSYLENKCPLLLKQVDRYKPKKMTSMSVASL